MLVSRQQSWSPRSCQKTPEDLRKKVVEKHRDGQSYVAIASSLSVPKSTVASLVQKWKRHGTTVNLWRTGRPSKITTKGKRKLLREARANPSVTLEDLKKSLQGAGTNVHKSTYPALYTRKVSMGVLQRRSHIWRNNISRLVCSMLPHIWKTLLRCGKVWSGQMKRK